jgi:UDP:flavonoid glycosyltransferase YjiC (YdhE family)
LYLTAPFITSWSMLDAMSCSCVVLASDQACTREYITHGKSRLLCDFFDAEGIAKQAVKVLRDPPAYRPLGDGARTTIEEKYSLDVCLPRVTRMFEETAAKGPRTPSVRYDALVRPGAPAPWKRCVASGPHAEVGVALPPFDGAVPFSLGGMGLQPGSLAPGTAENDRRLITRATRNGDGRTVLFAWENGAGSGHLMQMLPLAKDLAAAGHCVVMALRYLSRAVEVFGKAGVLFLQAPYRATGRPRPGRVAAFAQLLANVGFGDDNDLLGHASAWRNLIRSVGPDLLVCDYSPTALLAARDFPQVPRVVIGSGFCVPPDAVPADAAPGANGDGNRPRSVWAPLRPGLLAADPLPALAVEAEVLDRANWVLENWGRPPMERLGQLYSDVGETFLTTFPELDHFRDRPGAAYWGPVLDTEAGDEPAPPLWPDASGKRVFAYLKATPVLGEVLRTLAATKQPAVAFVDGLDPESAKRLGSDTVHVSERRVDVAAACRECDCAVLNGGHSVTSQMLLAGKPILAVPLVLEQQMTGAALERLGAGLSAPPRRGEPWEWAGKAKLESLLSDDGYADYARRFADRYAAFDPAAQRRAMLGRAEDLMAGAPASGAASAARS